MHTPRIVLSTFLAVFFLLPAAGDAQMRGQAGPGVPMMMAADPVELALDHAETLGLDPTQRSALEAFRAASLERSAEARQQLDSARERMRERMESRREAARGERPGRERGEWTRGERPRGESARGERARPPRVEGARGERRMNPALREALQTVREEQRAGMALLRETLSTEQRSELRQLLRRDRPRRPGPGHDAHG